MVPIVGGLLLIALTVLTFFICPSERYSCQVTQAFSLVFGIIGVTFVAAGIVVWRDQKRKDAAKPDQIE